MQETLFSPEQRGSTISQTASKRTEKHEPIDM
jgi:hypothetical protein